MEDNSGLPGGHDEFKKENSLLKHVKSFTQIVEEAHDPREILLYPWLPKAGLAMIFAETGIGKTYFCLNIAYAISANKSFLNYTTGRSAKVLYVDGEMYYGDMRERIIDIQKLQGIHEFPQNFYLLNPDKVPNYKMPKISTLEGQNEINYLIDNLGIEVLFLDNISTLTHGDENKGQDWELIQNWEIWLRAKGVSVVLIHHSGKNPKSQRGTTKREDILDTIIRLDKMEIEHNQSLRFKVVYQKGRSFKGNDKKSFEVVVNEKGEWNTKSIEQSTYDSVVLMANDGMTQIDIAHELGINKSNVCRAYKQGIDNKHIITESNSFQKRYGGKKWTKK